MMKNRKKKTIIREYKLSHTQKGMYGEVCLAFLTDLHNCLSQTEQDSLFELLENVKPDLVLVGGDVLVGKKGADIECAYHFMRKLSEKYKVIYANGNHEQRISLFPEEYGDMGKRYETLICTTKAIRARNRAINVDINKNSDRIPLTIYGFEPNIRFYKKGSRSEGMETELNQIFGKKEENRYHILLAHTPRYKKEYLSWGAHLTLSGHYHGGVMLLGKRRGVISPDFRLLSSDCCGICSQGDAHMIVSAGLGEHTIPLRIHNPRELTVVRISFS